ncbi:MAG TPA: 6-pyruvoyl-tetrahydropterin synthase-related protein [Blastocatellia bacterium]|nr:6-pyruvoyl-tetrahydropterin synthase-related protein [Blastocatellia bacterium]
MRPSRSARNVSGSKTTESISNSESLRQPGLISRDLRACLLVIGIATLVMLPMFVRGFPSGVDSDWHFRRALAFKEAMGDGGTFYPRWLSSLNNGMGSPVMLYYPPLSFFVTAAANFVVKDTLLSLSLSCWAGLAASGLAMYFAARSWVPHWPAISCALLYIIAPYHLLDLYQGTTLGEFWSFAWVPLVILAVHQISIGGGWRAVGFLAVGYSLLLFSHIPISFALSVLLPVLALAMTRTSKRLAEVALGLLLGAGLSAIYILPLLFERKYVRMDAILRFEYPMYFLFEHLRPAFKLGLMKSEVSSFSDPLNLNAYIYLLKTEQAALVLPILFAISTAIIVLNSKGAAQRFWQSRAIRSVWLITIVSLLMSIRLSAPVWRSIPQFVYLSFPFRWLVIATAGTCILTAVALSVLSDQVKRRLVYSATLASAVLCGLVISSFIVARAPYEPGAFDASEPRREVPEYRPIWWDNKLHDEEPLAPIVVTEGHASFEALDAEGIRQSYEVSARAAAVLKLHTLYFPGWNARVDGARAEIEPSKEGNIQIRIGPGEHKLSLAFEDTAPRLLGKVVSATALLAVLAMFYKSSRFRFWRREHRQLVVGEALE